MDKVEINKNDHAASTLRNASLRTVGDGKGLAELLRSLADERLLIDSLRNKRVEVIIREVKS